MSPIARRDMSPGERHGARLAPLAAHDPWQEEDDRPSGYVRSRRMPFTIILEELLGPPATSAPTWSSQCPGCGRHLRDEANTARQVHPDEIPTPMRGYNPGRWWHADCAHHYTVTIRDAGRWLPPPRTLA